jgi:hypothetical protein
MGVGVSVGAGVGVTGVAVELSVAIGREVAKGAAVGWLVSVTPTLVAGGSGVEMAADCVSPHAASSSASTSVSHGRRSNDVFISAL